MSQEMNFAELHTLKEQFSIFSQELEKQASINKTILEEAINKKLSFAEKEYRKHISICLIAAPVLTVVFISMGFHWGFIVLMDCIALAEFYLNRQCFRALNPKQMTGLSMTEVGGKGIKYKQLRLKTNKILAIPTVFLAVWTVLIACGYSWHLPIIAATSCLLVLGLSIKIATEKDVRKRLDNVLKKIEELKR